MAITFRQYDYGSILVITVKEDGAVKDLRFASEITLSFIKPDETVLTRTPEFLNDGEDGKVRYRFQNGELDQTGRWPFQLFVKFPEGAWNSSVGSFNVVANLLNS